METKQEFIDGLRRALTGRISQEEIEEHIRYYEDYITAETRIKGTEQEVLNALGNPKLIAMSICAADEAGMHGKSGYKANDTGYGNEYAYRSEDGYNGAGYYGQDDNINDERYNDTKDDRPFIFRHPKLTITMILIGILIVVVLVIALAFSLLKLLWPIIVVAILVILIVRLMAYFTNR